MSFIKSLFSFVWRWALISALLTGGIYCFCRETRIAATLDDKPLSGAAIEQGVNTDEYKPLPVVPPELREPPKNAYGVLISENDSRCPDRAVRMSPGSKDVTMGCWEFKVLGSASGRPSTATISELYFQVNVSYGDEYPFEPMKERAASYLTNCWLYDSWSKKLVAGPHQPNIHGEIAFNDFHFAQMMNLKCDIVKNPPEYKNVYLAIGFASHQKSDIEVGFASSKNGNFIPIFTKYPWWQSNDDPFVTVYLKQP